MCEREAFKFILICSFGFKMPDDWRVFYSLVVGISLFSSLPIRKKHKILEEFLSIQFFRTKLIKL